MTLTLDRARVTNRPDVGADRDQVAAVGDEAEDQDGRDQGHRRGQGEHPLVGRPGDDRLLLDELDPVGHQLEHAVEAAGLHRPHPGLHVGHDLVLHVPDEQGKVRNRTSTASTLTGISTQKLSRASRTASITGRCPPR
jgi:hypothetical protein